MGNANFQLGKMEPPMITFVLSMRILHVKTRFLMETKRKVFLFQLKLAKVTMFLHQEFLDLSRVLLKVSLVPTEEVEGQDMEETMVGIDIAMVQTITINNHAKLSTNSNVLINRNKNVNTLIKL